MENEDYKATMSKNSEASSPKNADQRLRDRKQPEYSQAKGHNKRVRDLYPEAWANSTITDRVLADWIKDNKSNPCPYCQGKVKEVDHVIPLSKGGQHCLENLELLCMPCNRAKGDKLPDEFKQWLGSNPHPTQYTPDEAILRPNGRYRTKSLFKDFDPDNGIWTLEEFKCLYLTYQDPTEYTVAISLLGTWKHWTKVCKCISLRGWLRELRSELKVKIRSRAAQALIQSENVAALKMLATEDIDFLSPQAPRPVGRPTKSPEVFDESLEIAEDLKRINLN